MVGSGRGLLCVPALVLALLLAAPPVPGAEIPPRPLATGEGPVDFVGVHNVVRLSERLYSGGVPEGQAGFEALRVLGIRTIITVDGAPPDLAAARRAGMRYVHLPFGYDTCPAPLAHRIVKAVRELPGPVFIHCHHGKHRSPTAAAFARIALDGLSHEEAVRELERAGTGKHYVGLYGAVRDYRPPTPAELDRMPADFPEVTPPPPLVETMVRMEQHLTSLQRAHAAGWRVPPGEAGGVPAHQALQLRELYTELGRMRDTRRRPADYRAWVRAGERDGLALEAALRAGRGAEAGAALGRMIAGCGSCHARYRNVPRGRGE
jgi:protein tyrosine phosphatase (PTP) superfamily phosphohydrolase (DUF442 family)/cytochrome c553